MKNGICPKCAGTHVYHQRGSRYMSEAVVLQDAVIGKGANPEKYICTSCGYLEYYLLEQDLQIVRDNWGKVTPTTREG